MVEWPMSNLQNSAGIYRIKVDRGTDRPPMVYIGQAAILRKRRSKHFSELSRGVHKNAGMQRAFEQYGAAAFSFEIILVCQRQPDILNLYEQSILDNASPEYIFNVNLECVGSRLGRAMSQETKAKIGAANKGRQRSQEHRESVGRSNQARIVSQETRDKMSAAHMGNRGNSGRRLSDEHKRKVGAFFKGKRKPPDEIARRQATRAAHRAAHGMLVY